MAESDYLKTNQNIINRFKVKKDTSAAISIAKGYLATTQYDKYP